MKRRLLPTLLALSALVLGGCIFPENSPQSSRPSFGGGGASQQNTHVSEEDGDGGGSGSPGL